MDHKNCVEPLLNSHLVSKPLFEALKQWFYSQKSPFSAQKFTYEGGKTTRKRNSTENFHVAKVVGWVEGYGTQFLFFTCRHVYMPLRGSNVTDFWYFGSQNSPFRKSKWNTICQKKSIFFGLFKPIRKSDNIGLGPFANPVKRHRRQNRPPTDKKKATFFDFRGSSGPPL